MTFASALRIPLTCAVLSLVVPLFGQGVNISTGQWLRVRITEDGVYRLTGKQLREAGLVISGKDPGKLVVLTHQGRMMNETNVASAHGTAELPVWVEGQSDGIFDDNDYLLFYGAAPHGWRYDGNSWRHFLNFYSDYTYFYIGFSNSPGKRMVRLTQPAVTPDIITDRTEVLAWHERELENPNHMGRTWLGEKMGNETLTRTVGISMPGNANDTFTVRANLAGGMIDGNGSVQANINGIAQTYSFSRVITDYTSFDQQERSFSVVSPSGAISAQFTLNRPNSKSGAWVDYLEVLGWMPAGTNGNTLMFRNRNIIGNVNAEIRLYGNNLELWNVSEPMSPEALELTTSGSYLKALAPAGMNKRVFAAFNPSMVPGPEVLGLYSSPDLTERGTGDMLIITHPAFRKAADRLAALRTANQGYKVVVAEVQEIYNQYSTSQQDIVAIRDYIRNVYRRSQNTANPLKFVLLLGSTSYDMKDRVPSNTNFIPIYQFNSPNKGATFSLDDFYGYLDSLSGDPEKYNNKMTVAVGRIPCRTEAEALGFVAKLERYDSPNSLGEWRTDLAFVSDDVDESWETIFTAESEKYARFIDTTYRYINVNKIFMDAYRQVSTGNTEKYPDVNAAISRYMSNGCLFMNYQGHGGPAGWAQESILDVPTIRAWNNTWRMPVMFTATCEFSLYDDPKEQSGGELALLNPNGGPIALMSTTRLVFVSGNMAINNDFWTNYGFPKPDEPIPTLGELFRRLKNRPQITSEDNKFALLGDPSMPLAFPKHLVTLDSVNGKSAAGYGDTLKAFSVVRMKGHIEERLKGKFSTFNGNLWVRVYDKPQIRTTLVNDNLGGAIPFRDQSSIIYKGVVSVVNGEFQVLFTVPKDIAYNVDFGKILFYAHNGVTDAAGGVRLKIGGSESNLQPDNRGPVVQGFMNDSSFADGGKVQPNTWLYARVFDENGLNSTGAGIGRDMVAVLDEGTPNEQTLILNEFFTYDLNSYTRGAIRMPLNGLSEGKHSIRIRVWDIYNNSGEDVVNFEVAGTEFLVTGHHAFPNPFSEEVGIAFRHNMPGADVKAEVEIADMQGRRLHTFSTSISNTNALETRIEWPGYTVYQNGLTTATLPAGIYIYRVRLTAGTKQTSFSGRMVKY